MTTTARGACPRRRTMAIPASGCQPPRSAPQGAAAPMPRPLGHSAPGHRAGQPGLGGVGSAWGCFPWELTGEGPGAAWGSVSRAYSWGCGSAHSTGTPARLPGPLDPLPAHFAGAARPSGEDGRSPARCASALSVNPNQHPPRCGLGRYRRWSGAPPLSPASACTSHRLRR